MQPTHVLVNHRVVIAIFGCSQCILKKRRRSMLDIENLLCITVCHCKLDYQDDVSMVVFLRT